MDDYEVLSSKFKSSDEVKRKWQLLLIVGGFKANSLAILNGAMHLLSDVRCCFIFLFRVLFMVCGMGSYSSQDYIFYRIEILNALVSMQLIWLLAGWEAIDRFVVGPQKVEDFLMSLVAAIGLVINNITTLSKSASEAKKFVQRMKSHHYIYSL